VAARGHGRISGNPGLHAGGPDAIRKVRAGRDAATCGAAWPVDTWPPTVRRMRSAQPWGDVVRVLNRRTGFTWTVEWLRRTARRLVSEGIVEATLRDCAPRQQSDDRLLRLVSPVSGRLRLIAHYSRSPHSLEAMRGCSPRVETRWHPSSVEHLLTRAEKLGFAGAPPAQVDPWVWR
jgi:hypothetical protein